MTQLDHLFSPLTIRGVTMRNRIFSTGHQTLLAVGDTVSPGLIAYQEARAAGGAGLVILEVAGVHESAYFVDNCLMAHTDACIPGYREMAARVHAHGCKVFGQLFHPGKEVLGSDDGSASVAYAPSAIPNERYKVMPRAMSGRMVREIVDGHGSAARRMQEAGLDGVEIVASHGYLPAQFLNPRHNLREDEWGGDLTGRLRFTTECIAAIRREVGEDMVVGMRISGHEMDDVGLQPDEVMEACVALDRQGGLDYLNVIAGTSDTFQGQPHIVPPMFVETGYVAPYSAAIREKVSMPVFVAGRINDPRIAEEILAGGQADMCGMTRAMICDPAMPNKAGAGRLDDVRACIGCNQACIGHMRLGYSISCIQYPESGREIAYGSRVAAAAPKRVLVAGGGPGGMKAAAVAAERGHQVTLYEASARLGGQVLLAQALPGREEFGGVVTNLAREMALAGVEVVTKTAVTPALIEREAPDAVIVATGARPLRPEIEGAEEGHVLDAWQVLRDEANVGASVVIADWRCDWVGLGLAEKLARAGCRVRLCVNGYAPGQTIMPYIRDHWAGVIHALGVEVVTYARLHGVDADTVYMQHAASGAPMLLEGVDTLVLALGHESDRALEDALDDYGGELHMVGDCLSPRTVEEAILEGLKAAVAV